MLLGLLPVGLGAALLWPLLAWRAAGVLAQPRLPARERRLTWLALALACMLGCAGVFFSLLLLLRLWG